MILKRLVLIRTSFHLCIFLFLLEYGKLNKKRINSCLLSLIGISQFAFSFESFAASKASYYGSYLFCANDNGLKQDAYWNRKVEWRWSNGTALNSNQNTIGDEYSNFTFVNKSGTWINGFGDESAKTGQHFLLVRKTFENKQEAVNYCQTLENKCKNEFGSTFKHVGVSSWSIPKSAWGTIAVQYKEDKSTKWTACSNWQFSDYKELNYYPKWKVYNAAAIAAGGMIFYPIVNGFTGGAAGLVLGIVPGAMNLNPVAVSVGGTLGLQIGQFIGTTYGIYYGINEIFNIYNETANQINQSQD